MRIELIYAPGCPNTVVARARVRAAMRLLEIGDRCLTERLDPTRPSPSVLVDGTDVMGTPPTSDAACRLDLPTAERLLAAMSAAATKPISEHGRIS